MEPDDLKAAWRELERRLEATESLVREVKLGRALRWLTWGQSVQLVVWTAAALFAGSFWFEHRGTPHLLACGVAMNLYAALAIGSCVLQIVLAARVDFAAPITTVQSQLALLRRRRIAAQLVLGLPWWFLWVVVAELLAKSVMGFDLYLGSPEWFIGCLAAGVPGIGLSLALPRLLARTPGGRGFIQRRLDDLAGRSLARATRELDEIARFGSD